MTSKKSVKPTMSSNTPVQPATKKPRDIKKTVIPGTQAVSPPITKSDQSDEQQFLKERAQGAAGMVRHIDAMKKPAKKSGRGSQD